MGLRFLDIPPEIREQIYGEILSTASSRCESICPEEPASYKFQLNILLTNRQINHEAKKVFQDNIFIKITTPWLEAIEHIRGEGKVPSVCSGDKASSFRDHHLWIFIDTPATTYRHSHNNFSMLICIEDLEAFTRMWHFSNLNHVGLNQHLRLKLTIQDPHVEERKIPKRLQQRLLLPFGAIKELHSFSVHGQNSPLLPSVEEALKKEQAIPDPTPEESLAKGFTLKDAGNAHLKAGSYHQALELYIQAFAAIYITVSGRSRTIHADGYYIRELTSGTHTGMRGDFVRMILRVQLVANIVLTYLKMEDYAEAHFWGKRTIVLFRQSVTGDDAEDFGDDDPQVWLSESWAARFPAHEAMGKIFYRTAMASKRLGKMGDVRNLMRAARIYLPNDEKVQLELNILEGGKV